MKQKTFRPGISVRVLEANVNLIQWISSIATHTECILLVHAIKGILWLLNCHWECSLCFYYLYCYFVRFWGWPFFALFCFVFPVSWYYYSFPYLLRACNFFWSNKLIAQLIDMSKGSRYVKGLPKLISYILAAPEMLTILVNLEKWYSSVWGH